jgi:hypothetical protein
MWTEPRGPVPSSNRQADAADARAPTLPACRLGVRVEIRRLADGGLQGRFPELVASVFALEVPTLVLDSEVAVFDRQLISRFE